MSGLGVRSGDDAAASGKVRSALRETGAIGATVRQIATRLTDSPARVEAALARLERGGRVHRMGRGLYVLTDFERLADRTDFAGPAEYVERFERETGITLGTYPGPITFRSNEQLPVHRWWPFVQGYSAEFVRSVIDAADLRRGAVVLDPFSGSGTSVVEARRLGARALGTELLPPAVLAARVKSHFELDPEALGRLADRTLRAAAGRTAGPLPFLRETRRQFSGDALRDLTRLRDALPPEGTPVADAVRLAFGRILIPSSRLHRSPCLGYARTTTDDGTTPFDRFRDAVRTMQEDLVAGRTDRARWGPPARIERRDARAGIAAAGTVDLAVTSPPYVNGMDYVMNYKLDLAWLGYVDSYAGLASLRREEVACDNLPRSETAPYLTIDAELDPWLGEILPLMRANVARKGTYRRDDVHAVVHRYFADLSQVISSVRRALRPGGRFVLVVGDSLLAGVYVPGDLLLARLGAKVGLRPVSVDVARARRSGQRRSFKLRETVVTLERPRSDSP